MTDTLQLNQIVNLLKPLPQQNTQQLLNNLLLLQASNYQQGNRKLNKITNELPDDQSILNLFSIYNEIFVTDVNTVILSSTIPFYLRINSSLILENIYNFTYVSSNQIDVYVANLSTETDVIINYVIANTDLLGSSYVYS